MVRISITSNEDSAHISERNNDDIENKDVGEDKVGEDRDGDVNDGLDGQPHLVLEETKQQGVHRYQPGASAFTRNE